MKIYKVSFRPRARKDLISLYRYIAKQASPRIAANYIGRIEKACSALVSLPCRGTAIPSRVSGLRTMGFERRATILFAVGEEKVEILRVYYGGQDLEPEIKGLLGILAEKQFSPSIGSHSGLRRQVFERKGKKN